jgi:hypothetical protein
MAKAKPSTSITIPLRADNALVLANELIVSAAHAVHGNNWVLITLNGPTVIRVVAAERRDDDEGR